MKILVQPQNRLGETNGMSMVAYGGHFFVAATLLFLAISPVLGQTDAVQNEDDEVVLPGTIEGLYRTAMMSRLEGYIGDVLVDIGDHVKKGDSLIVLNAPEVLVDVARHNRMVEKTIADVASAEAELASVEAQESALAARENLRKSELDRITKLVESGAVTTTKGDEAKYSLEAVLSERMVFAAEAKAVKAKLVATKATVEVAKADLAHANAMRDYLTIRAPFDGVVTQRNVDPGAYVRPPNNDTKPLLLIESVDRMRLVVMVPYASAGRLDVGDAVIFSGLRGRVGVTIPGKITRKSFGFEERSRMMRAEVELDNRPDPKTGKRRLRSGDYGSVTITLEESKNVSLARDNELSTVRAGQMMQQVDLDDEVLLLEKQLSAMVSRAAGRVEIVNGVDLFKDER